MSLHRYLRTGPAIRFVGLAGLVLFPTGCTTALAQGVDLDLEYQCVEGSERMLKKPNQTSVGLVSVYTGAGIDVTVHPSVLPSDECIPVDIEPENGFPLESVYSWIYDEDGNHKPEGIKKRLRSGDEESWYAFGLAVPKVFGTSKNGAIFLNHLWDGQFQDLECTDVSDLDEWYVREDFLILTNPDYPEPSALSLDQWRTEIHELAHVLNTHHADFPLFEGNDLGSGVTQHLGAHEIEALADYVEPGEGGSPWCCYPTDHETDGHLFLNSDGEPELKPSSCDSLDTLIELASSGSGFPFGFREGAQRLEPGVFTLLPEKDRYIQGEPVRISAVIKNRFAFLDYPEDISLDPQLGLLRVFTTRGTGPGRFWPLSHLLHADTDLEFVPLPSEISATGIDTWFDRRRTGRNRPSREVRRYSLQAAYTGIRTVGKNVRSPRRVVLLSDPITIIEDPPRNEDEREAYTHFTTREAKLFLFLLGGDGLEVGKGKMELVAGKYSDSIYAPYANLALGMNLLRPYYAYVREEESGRIVLERDSDPENALGRLTKARRRECDLPRSYRQVLYQALVEAQVARAEEMRVGDRREEAADLLRSAYRDARVALSRITDLAGLDRPLSRSEKELIERFHSHRKEIESSLQSIKQE